MRLKNCILLSVLFHLIFFGILGGAFSDGHEREQVFNVDIVEIPPLKPPDIKRSKPILKKRPLVSHRRRPPIKSLPPNTILDESLASPSGKGGEAAARDKKSEPLPDKGPSFLFDRDIIEKYANKNPEPDKGVTFDASEFKHRGYLRQLKERIESIWEYPKEAARKKMSGELYIKFTITRKGEIGEAEVIRTSGHRSLDLAAIKALKKAAPFWPLPDNWPDEQLEITGHFIYIYGSTYVM